jgi:hypothetical protein
MLNQGGKKFIFKTTRGRKEKEEGSSHKMIGTFPQNLKCKNTNYLGEVFGEI